MATKARRHSRLRHRGLYGQKFGHRRRGLAGASAHLGGRAFDRWLGRPADDWFQRLDRPTVVERALGAEPSTVPLGPDLDLTLVVADLLCRAIDRFPSARRVAEDQPPHLHVQVVRLPDGTVTTLANGKFKSVECPGCGDLTLIAGYGVCLSCRTERHVAYEVVS